MLLAKVRRRPDLDTCFISPSRFFSWDFLFGFLPTTSVSLFRDYLPAPLICKSIFKSALGFSLTRRVFRCPFCSQRSFSPGCEDTSSVVAVVFIKGMNNGILIVVLGGRRWCGAPKTHVQPLRNPNLERFKKYYSRSVRAVFLSFGFVSAQLQATAGMRFRQSLARTQKSSLRTATLFLETL